MFEWSNIWRGMLIGTSDLIPGVSGGTIAVILGFYDRLIAAISGFFSKDWKKHIGFLLPLGIGVGIALVLLSKVMKWLLEYHPQPTFFFFMGLILGIIPFLVRAADVKTNFRAGHVGILIVAAVLVALTGVFRPDEVMSQTIPLTLTSGIGLFFAGWLASMAMLLPGISGSFVLLLLGVYPTAIEALSTLNIPLIMVIGAGVIVGFVVSSKLIKMLLSRCPHVMYAIIIGMVIGSLYVIFPGIPTEIGTIVLSVLTLLLGLGSALYLGKHES
ncbi:DUF368 domain-containing protein [Paenibacillus marinisediminis]